MVLLFLEESQETKSLEQTIPQSCTQKMWNIFYRRLEKTPKRKVEKLLIIIIMLQIS